ncbi:Hypothetical predicted protein [Xyrichtys novacula]|uniref:Uncharacterized protein n=1 Tax=Xyrichtys novacula TaxID=13765 RepID=A0AAV1F386_XYRNO|nr:Hypothetical predicted protein [Xyrichtys novacula]
MERRAAVTLHTSVTAICKHPPGEGGEGRGERRQMEADQKLPFILKVKSQNSPDVRLPDLLLSSYWFYCNMMTGQRRTRHR